MQRFACWALLLGIVVIWGWTFALVKDAVATAGVISFLAVRFVIAALVMGCFSARRLTGRAVMTGGGIGLVLAAAYLLQTWGLFHSTATNTGLITGLFIVFVPLLNWGLFGVRTSPRRWGIIAISVGGLLLLTGGGSSRMSAGDLLTSGAAGCLGLHMVLLERYARHHDATALTVSQVAVAAVVFCGLWPAAGGSLVLSGEVCFALVITGVGATAAGFYVQTFVQQRISSLETGLIVLTEPIFAAAFGFWLHGDQLTALQWSGGTIMLLAVYGLVLVPEGNAQAKLACEQATS